MTSRWQWVISELSQKLWVVTVIYALLGFATALVARLIGPFLPAGLGADFGAGSVDAVLTILASSMLSVTTFSLGIMVTAFANAASTITPRVTGLLMQDRTAQRVLATFLGAFIYSLVGIIGVKAGFYGANGRFVLFVVTIGVVMLIVGAMLRWISHLTTFGLRNDTHERVEEQASEALDRRVKAPYLGGHPLTGPIPSEAQPVMARKTGYVGHIDLGDLQGLADENGAHIYLAVVPGSFVHLAAPLVWVTGAETAEIPLARAFSIGETRRFEQDPRFGLCVITEIAERALSPAVNDPGTAIDILSRVVRILSLWTERGEVALDYPSLWVPPLQVADMLEDVFPPIARDAAGIWSVQIRLQKALLALVQIDAVVFGAAALLQSHDAIARVGGRLLPAEIASLQEVCDQIAELAERPARRGI